MSNPKIPAEFKWLEREPGPKMLVEALKLVGTKEVVGKVHNPVIMGWAKELGLQSIYTSDELAWCGLSHAYVALKAGKSVPFKGWEILRALNYATFGVPVKKAMLGDTLVFKRPEGGHVGIYCGETKNVYLVLGGNQSNSYGFTWIVKDRCVAIRRPVYSIAQPENVRTIALNSSGRLSENEA